MLPPCCLCIHPYSFQNKESMQKKMEVAVSFEMLISLCQTLWRHIPEETKSHLLQYERHSSHKASWAWWPS
jgi:hypothetical protein